MCTCCVLSAGICGLCPSTEPAQRHIFAQNQAEIINFAAGRDTVVLAEFSGYTATTEAVKKLHQHV